MLTLQNKDALAVALCKAIQAGDKPSLERLLAEHPEAASARIGDAKGSKALLHVATDWPGHFPHVGEIIGLLIQRGADPNATTLGEGSDRETPLHWAASSDDVVAIDALLDGGANLEAPGSIIDGGAPLNNAVAFAQFNAARRLVARGAKTQLWHAAALGMLSSVKKYFGRTPPPSPQEVDGVFWNACRGGQFETAAFLLTRGAHVNAIPPWSKETPLDMALTDSPGRPATAELVAWLKSVGAKTASELTQS